MTLKSYNNRPVNLGTIEYHIKDLVEHLEVVESLVNALNESVQVLSTSVESMESRLRILEAYSITKKSHTVFIPSAGPIGD